MAASTSSSTETTSYSKASPGSAVSPEIGVILGQVGTPQSLDRAEIRRYLKEFLSDDRVIDLPRWRWMPILHGAVLPVRPGRIGGHYSEIWTEQGSPLQVISNAQRDGLQERLGPRFQVELGMAYSQPSIEGAVSRLEGLGIRKIVVLPMFPQYSNSTTASIYDAVSFHALGRPRKTGLPAKKFSPTLRFIHPYFDDPKYLQVLAANISAQVSRLPNPDHFIFSFHGLPKRFIDEGDPYKAQVEKTVDLLAAELGLSKGSYELGFQSRFGRTEWIRPYLQPRLEELSASGVERPVVISPGFTTDCLETLHELGIEGRELFEKGGGEAANYHTIGCLNDDPAWLDYAAGLISNNAVGW